MAHEIYTTDTLVLASVEVQDADKLFWLLTKDFGLIFASAKSVREEVSKLRYSLQDLLYTQVSLVRGRGMWRITGADTQKSIGILSVPAQVVFGRIASLAKRVIPIDERHEKVYETMLGAYIALTNRGIPHNFIEHVSVARLLYHLGYVSIQDDLRDIFNGDDYVSIKNIYTSRVEGLLINVINNGISQSQL